jgi:hypothetical protein
MILNGKFRFACSRLLDALGLFALSELILLNYRMLQSP